MAVEAPPQSKWEEWNSRVTFWRQQVAYHNEQAAKAERQAMWCKATRDKWPKPPASTA